jgi:hypothetical protein
MSGLPLELKASEAKPRTRKQVGIFASLATMLFCPASGGAVALTEQI